MHHARTHAHHALQQDKEEYSISFFLSCGLGAISAGNLVPISQIRTTITRPLSLSLSLSRDTFFLPLFCGQRCHVREEKRILVDRNVCCCSIPTVAAAALRHLCYVLVVFCSYLPLFFSPLFFLGQIVSSVFVGVPTLKEDDGASQSGRQVHTATSCTLATI